MTHPNVALVAKAFQALNGRDLDNFISAFADDAVLHGADGQIEGKEAILSVIHQASHRVRQDVFCVGRAYQAGGEPNQAICMRRVGVNGPLVDHGHHHK